MVRIDAIYYSFLDEHQEARFVSVIIRNSDIRGHPNFAREIDIIEIFPVFSRRIDPTLRFALLSIFTLFLFLFFREAFTRRFFLANTSPWCGVKLWSVRMENDSPFFRGRESKPERFSFGYTEINLPGSRTN